VNVVSEQSQQLGIVMAHSNLFLDYARY